LRLLLHHVRAATSFQDARTVDGVVCATFKEAAIRRGLLEDDNEQTACLKEASEVKMPRALRQLFASLLLFSVPKDPKKLWEEHKTALTEDLLRVAGLVRCLLGGCGSFCVSADVSPVQRERPHGMATDQDSADDEALRDIQRHLQNQGKTLADFPDMPIPPPPSITELLSRVEQEERVFNNPALLEKVERWMGQLNRDQRDVFETVDDALKQERVDRRVRF
jgi:hypothetical protein